MKIDINQDDIAKAIEQSATAAIADRMGGYKVRDAIAEVITDEVATGLVSAAIRTAVSEVDISTLTTALAREISKAMAAATVTIMQDAAVNLVAKIRGIADYDSDRERKYSAVKVEMFGKNTGRDVRSEHGVSF